MNTDIMESVANLAALTHRKIEEYDQESSELYSMYSNCKFAYPTKQDREAIKSKQEKVEQLHDDVVDCTIMLTAAQEMVHVFDDLVGL